MSSILITGANGFIGQHLARSLLDSGHRVRAIAHGDHPLYFVKKEEVEWREADLAKPATLNNIAQNIDIVYHLAAIPRNDLRRTWEDFRTVNIDGTRALLLEAEKAGVKRFVFVSTVEAAGYGDGLKPRSEEDAPHPHNNYGKSKLEAEEIVLNGKWKMECSVLRLPMIYGPGTFLIVPKLFGMVKRWFYPLIGSGLSQMEFCYVENAVQAIRLCGENKKADGQLFYASDERSYTIREVVENIAKAMDQKVLFIHVPAFLANMLGLFCEITAKLLPFPPIVSPYSKKPFFTRETVKWTTSNINTVSTIKIRTLLGYNPKVNIQMGCQMTAHWLKKHGL